jgi:hypothetical protein
VAFWNRLFHKKDGSEELSGREEDKLQELEEDLDEEESENGLFEVDKKEVSSEGSEEEEYEIVEREIHPAKIICPECGGITLEGLEFCDKCGGELQ